MKINPEYALPQNNNIKPSTSNNEETNVSVFNDKMGMVSLIKMISVMKNLKNLKIMDYIDYLMEKNGQII